jgi:hypothetical protein
MDLLSTFDKIDPAIFSFLFCRLTLTVEPPHPVHRGSQPALGLVLRGYLLALALALPMDWFSWTGNLLREAGARPAIPLMVVASAVIFLSRKNFWVRFPAQVRGILQIFLLIALCGMIAFFFNLALAWSYFGGSKEPVTQAGAQFALFILTPILMVAHAGLFQAPAVRGQFLRFIPVAAACHLAGLLMEIMGLLHPLQFPLSLFRLTGEVGPQTLRAAGLFSEPSYFGMMAAMYSLPLLLVPWRGRVRRTLYAILALALITASFLIGAKTVIPVLICGIIAFFWHSRTKILTIPRVLALCTLGIIFGAFIISKSALSVSDNLSTAMRFGSTVTAIRVASAGYGITGVGFGQFHFLFRQEYFPSYLFLSQEAIEASQRTAAHRASTYNLFARYLVETGIAGLILWLCLLARFARIARSSLEDSMRVGVLLIGTSLGFLLTQDPYCFPPLIVGMALVIAASPAPHSRPEPISPS